MTQKIRCLCGNETTGIFALPAGENALITPLIENPAKPQQKFVQFGLCMSCIELMGQQVKLLQKIKFAEKAGAGKQEDELVGYLATITQSGETGGEGETGLVTNIATVQGDKLASVVTPKEVYWKKLVNVKKILAE